MLKSLNEGRKNMKTSSKKKTKTIYEIEENRLKSIIKKVVRGLDIDGIYRIQIEFPKNYETWLTTQSSPVLALFFDTVYSTSDIHEKKREIEENLKYILNMNFLIVPIPYSDAKYHLRKPRNI